MATDAERRAAFVANKKALDAKRGTRSDAEKQKSIGSARTAMNALFFVLPGGAIIRVASGAKRALQAVRAMKGAKPIAKPTATQISKAKAPTQAQLKPLDSTKVSAGKQLKNALPKPKSGNTTLLKNKPTDNVISGTAREVKPGTSVVPSGGRAVKKPGTGVQPDRVVKMKNKRGMKNATRNDKRVTGGKPNKKTGLPNVGRTITAALIAGMAAGTGGDKKPSASTNKSTTKKVITPNPKTNKPSKVVDLGTVKARKVTPQTDAKPKKKVETKKAAPSKVISAGSSTGFGDKGNIFPGNAEERKALMDKWGGTGSAAAKAARAGKQGNIKGGDAAIKAARNKRLSKSRG
tara:strand:- start:654 stop:1700 length:1047 start_codon:yes stop_codon:yes gene_type:complete